jgi:hypothetical protein
MAQITGKMNTTSLSVYFGGTKITHQTDASLSFTHEARDVSTKDSAGWTEHLEGRRGWQISGTFFYADDATHGVDEIWAQVVTARATVACILGTGVAGNAEYSGSAYFSQFEINSPSSEDTASVSYTLVGTAALTKATTA